MAETATRRFTLRTTLTSPFGRKVRMAAEILGMSQSVDILPADTLDPNDSLRLQNPLGKMPCLLLPDRTALFDSRTIIEYFQEEACDFRLLARAGEARYRVLTDAVLADGVTDAALLMVYESRFRSPGQESGVWLDHQRGKIARALGRFDRKPPSLVPIDLSSLALACALEYLDWRRPVAWRSDYLNLVAWLKDFERTEPALRLTRAPSP